MASSLFARFVTLYYAHLAADDAKDRSPADLDGAARAHLRLAEDRMPGEPLVRVYTPTFDQDGYESTHTIAEIVTDDMPFLVDSVGMELTRHGVGIHLVVHPIIGVRRDDRGHLIDLDEDGPREAFMHFEVDRETDPAALRALRADLLRVLGDVRAAVDDWDEMRTRLAEVADALTDPADAETASLLAWMADDHFTFLGYRNTQAPGSGLGLLRGVGVADGEVAAHAGVTVRKADGRATVHRPVAMEQVCVGPHQFLGLWSRAAYSTSPLEIPLLRRKVETILDRSGLPRASHSGKDLEAILETYPRDELFQIDEEELLTTAMGILSLQERRRVRLFLRRDDLNRFFSCLVYVPRDRFTTELTERIEAILVDALCGTNVDSTASVSESVLARVHAIVSIAAGATPVTPDVPAIEAALADAARSWVDDFATELEEHNGEERGLDLLRRYHDGFPAAYREDVHPRSAVGDVARIESLLSGMLGADLLSIITRPADAPRGFVRMRLFRAGEPMALSDVVPLLEHLGVRVVDERPYEVHPADAPPLWIYDIGLASGDLSSLDSESNRMQFCEAFGRLWRGEAESDGFNRLVLRAGLSSRKVAVLRAYAKYLRQIGSTFSQSYIEDTLAGNAHIAAMLVELFETRFDPDRLGDRAEAEEELVTSVVAALNDVASLDEDRILSSFLHLVLATLRTSWYQRDASGAPKPYMSFKLDPARVPDLPLPRPLYEVWVYSPRCEGVHLRGGRIARGGIRWSDRREDFRTEILGLMKAQMVKNAVIVPVGAKGGFVVKRPPTTDRDAVQAEVEACYQILIRGLLDLTDNISGAEIVPPPRVVRYDDHDPYLVVAADKGTATFSDLANSMSAEYGFWLGDAFASGGSVGYDHKEMGITALGAWESVRRHFLNLGINPDKDRFTVVGIGDMSGDVFGNGMLQSQAMELVAAFDHRHLFLDPKPDPATSFVERKRLFDLPRSSWDDYDRSLISAGGGVWPRAAKSIPLSPEVRELLCTDADALTPAEVISAMLTAPVDLLFNGGIGTYVKASTESNSEVGDRSNDLLRVDGVDLRCRAVVEGGNLGFTQRGRVEYALAGGLINTDAIDNSAGVDTSDHEVNIKILLDGTVAAGDLTVKQRNALLDEMADEVAHLVLRNNYEQNRALANARAQAESMIDVHARYISSLESEDLIDRTLEFLPTERQLAERQASGVGLTTPEFAVLLAYTKTTNVREVLASDLPDDPFVADEIARYFPTPLRQRFRSEMDRHRLRREIVAMRIVNGTVNKAGISFDFRMTEETGASVVDSTRAHIAARAIFAMQDLWAPIEALDGAVAPDVQRRMVLALRHTVERGALWLLRHRRAPLDITATVAAFEDGVRELATAVPEVLFGTDRDNLESTAAAYVAAGVGQDLARRAAALDFQLSAFDIVEVARARGATVTESAAVFFALTDRLGIDWIRDRVFDLARDNEWQTLARAALRDDLLAEQRELTAEVVRLRGGDEAAYALVDSWIARNRPQVERFQSVLASIRAAGTFDLTTLSVAVRELRNLITTSRPAG